MFFIKRKGSWFTTDCAYCGEPTVEDTKRTLEFVIVDPKVWPNWPCYAQHVVYYVHRVCDNNAGKRRRARLEDAIYQDICDQTDLKREIGD